MKMRSTNYVHQVHPRGEVSRLAVCLDQQRGGGLHLRQQGKVQGCGSSSDVEHNLYSFIFPRSDFRAKDGILRAAAVSFRHPLSMLGWHHSTPSGSREAANREIGV